MKMFNYLKVTLTLSLALIALALIHVSAVRAAPATAPVLEDVALLAASSGTNQDGNALSFSGTGAPTNNPTSAVLLKLDVSASTVDAARINIDISAGNCAASAAATINVYEATDTWDETTATWDTPGATQGALLETVAYSGTGPLYIEDTTAGDGLAGYIATEQAGDGVASVWIETTELASIVGNDTEDALDNFGCTGGPYFTPEVQTGAPLAVTMSNSDAASTGVNWTLTAVIMVVASAATLFFVRQARKPEEDVA